MKILTHSLADVREFLTIVCCSSTKSTTVDSNCNGQFSNCRTCSQNITTASLATVQATTRRSRKSRVAQGLPINNLSTEAVVSPSMVTPEDDQCVAAGSYRLKCAENTGVSSVMDGLGIPTARDDIHSLCRVSDDTSPDRTGVHGVNAKKSFSCASAASCSPGQTICPATCWSTTG